MTKPLKTSAGLLMYRRVPDLEVFLVHPGGPYWMKKDEGSWTIPKGQREAGEQPLSAAIREFKEETGFETSQPFIELGSIRQKSGKVVFAWAFEGNCNPAGLVSNTCEIEWPPRSGKLLVIPEIDRGEWFSIRQAESFILKEQAPFLFTLGQQLTGEQERP